MSEVLSKMINKYNPINNTERENIIKEIFQEIVLAALSKSDFFSKAAFHGGTCLRIFHDIDRFSEDLDFALINNDDININDYAPYIIDLFKSFGIKVEATLNYKNNEVQTIL